QLDRALRVRQVVALGLLIRGLVHAFVDSVQIGARGDVERGKRSHGRGRWACGVGSGEWYLTARSPTPVRTGKYHSPLPTQFVVRRGSSPAPGLSRRDAAEPAPFP